jgi:hypothetical protein
MSHEKRCWPGCVESDCDGAGQYNGNPQSGSVGVA